MDPYTEHTQPNTQPAIREGETEERLTTEEMGPAPTMAERRVSVGERISWGAILGGAVTAMAVAMLLHALGFALGLSAIDPRVPSSFRASGMFTGIWSLVTWFVALFTGGFVASRVAGAITRTGGAIHGLVMWALTTVVGMLLLFNLVTHAISGAAAIGKTTVEAGANVAGKAGGVASALGVDFNDMLAPINKRLKAEGKPPVTAGQVEAASKDVAQKALQGGGLNRESLVASITRSTNLSRADANELADRVESALGSTGNAASSLQTGALRAAESTGMAFWGVFGTLAIGMISAVAGATVGVSKGQRMRPGRGTPGQARISRETFAQRHSHTYP